MRPISTATVFAALVLAPAAACPWGATGHRIVGRIAEHHLTPQAARAMAELLAPDSLAEVAPWADHIRSDPAWAEADPWHYVNIPDEKSYETSDPSPDGDVIAALERFEAVLRDPEASREEQRVALKFLVHLVGDLHQPLHVGRREDLGGNGIRVRWFEQRSNLHEVWDVKLIDLRALSFSEWVEFLDPPTRAEIRAWQSTDYRAWARESYDLRSRVYDFPGRTLEWDYAYRMLPVVELRLRQAGVRLAGVLNDVFGGRE